MSNRTLKSNSYLTAAEMLDTALADVKNHGHTATVASEMVAEFFEMTISRLKAFVFYDKEASPKELEHIKARYLDHLAEEHAYHVRRVAALRSRLEEAQKQ